MAQVIQIRRSAKLIVSHARSTLSRASVSTDQIHQDAQQFLKDGVVNAKTLSRAIEDKEEEIEDARSRVTREGIKLTRSMLGLKDEVFNKTERRANDMVLNQILPEGISQMHSFGAQRKVSFVEKIAIRFVTLPHPRIPSDLAKEYADRLRAAVKPLQEAINALAPLVADRDALHAQYYATARGLQIGLRNLKKHWMSQNITATEVHEYIPDGRPEVADADEERDSAESTKAGATEGDATEEDSGGEDGDAATATSDPTTGATAGQGAEASASSGSTEDPISSGST